MSFPITLLCDPAPEGIDAELTSRDQRRTERGLLGGEAKKIRCHAHLAIASIAGSDSNYGDTQLCAELLCDVSRNMLKDQGEASSLLEFHSLTFELVLALRVLGLAPVAQAMHRLGCQTQMTHHGDAHAHQSVDDANHLRLRALEFDGCGIRFLEQSPGRCNRPVRPALVTEKRQVDHDHGLLA